MSSYTYAFCSHINEDQLQRLATVAFLKQCITPFGVFCSNSYNTWIGNAVNCTSNALIDGDNGIYQSHAEYDGTSFRAITDCWGMRPHYYYVCNDVFICSNNLLLTAYIAGNYVFSRNALLDSLLFVVPQNDTTWFENVKQTTPGMRLSYDANRNLQLTEGNQSVLSKTGQVLPWPCDRPIT